MTSRSWAKWNAFKSFFKSFFKFLASHWLRSIVPFLALGAGASLPVLVTTIWLHEVEMEIYRVNMTAINIQLNELKIKLEGRVGSEVPDFPMTVIFFPTAKLTDRNDCQLDPSPGNGIGLLNGQKKQLDRLVDLVATINGQKKAVFQVKGFASTLRFSGLDDEQSNDCNLKVAKLRGEAVSAYLGSKGVAVETEPMADHTDENRPYPYGQETARNPRSRGIHALNQAAYVTISFR